MSMLLCPRSSSGGGPRDSTAEDGGGGIAEGSERECDEEAEASPSESKPLDPRSLIVSCSRASISRLLIAPTGTNVLESRVPGPELWCGER